MHRQTKATAIPISVKTAVWERDGGKCALCECNKAFPDAHFIARSHGGKGIEQNIVTLCRRCHDLYDNSEHRKAIRERLREYLMSKYPEWNEKELIYKKYDF